jgi:predicted Zn-dependent protease
MSPQQEYPVGRPGLPADPGQSAAVLRRCGERDGHTGWQPHRRRCGHPEYQWEYRLIQDDKQANAFALPGGKVAVYTGILPITRDENGLAAVLGHEIGHVIARHGGERVSQQTLVNVGLETTMAALSSGNPATVQAVASLLGAGATVGVLLPWGRAQESEADHIGLILMAKAGYDPHAAREL